MCLPEPDGYAFSRCLFEFAELVTFSLRDLGYDAILSVNDIHSDRRNVIVGCHLMAADLMTLVPPSTVVVNSEQIYDEDRFAWNDRIFSWARNFETWDYSPKNIAAFDRLGIPGVKLLQIGHQPQLTRITPAADQDIDVLFYGSITDRRLAVFQQIRDRGLKLTTLFKVFGAERDEYIARAKVVLNMHNHTSEIFEVVRAHYLLSNAVAVVSEVNTSTSIPAAYHDAVAGVPYESLAEECERLVADDTARNALQHRAISVISRYPQTDYTRQVLG